jgi:hypothetical protein
METLSLRNSEHRFLDFLLLDVLCVIIEFGVILLGPQQVVWTGLESSLPGQGGESSHSIWGVLCGDKGLGLSGLLGQGRDGILRQPRGMEQ